MPRGYRGKRLAPLEALFCVLVLFGLCALIYATGRTFGVEAGRNQVSARQHYENAKKDALRACVGRDGPALAQCVTEAIESAQSQSESRQDLYAQQDMAKWAFWMFIAAILTLGVTGLGVWYVRRTLSATLEAVEDTGKATEAMLKANQIAEDTAKRQQRAYIAVRPLGVEQLHSNSNLIGMVSVENVGQTPARNVDIYVNMFCSSSKTETKFPVKTNDTGSTLTIQPNMNVRKGTRPDNTKYDAARNYNYIYVFGVVLFDDEFHERRQSCFCHRYATVSKICDPTSVISIRADSPKAERVILEPGKARFHFAGNHSD